jgi:hypothetical protein
VSIEKLKGIIKQRDRTADIHALADAGLQSFGGTDELIAQIKLLYDDERTAIPVKARLIELVIDFIKESSKTRTATDPTDGLSTEELENALMGLVRTHGQDVPS